MVDFGVVVLAGLLKCVGSDVLQVGHVESPGIAVGVGPDIGQSRFSSRRAFFRTSDIVIIIAGGEAQDKDDAKQKELNGLDQRNHQTMEVLKF